MENQGTISERIALIQIEADSNLKELLALYYECEECGYAANINRINSLQEKTYDLLGEIKKLKLLTEINEN